MSATVLLLSGGASTRMGKDKASLPLADQDLLSWQEQRFQQAGFTVVSRLTDIYSGFLGPLAGIHSACTAYPNVESWVVIPVDMPMLTISAIRQLQEVGEQSNRPVCFNDCPLPLYVPNNEHLQRTLTQWLSDANGKRSVFALVRELNGDWLDERDCLSELMNINTPNQWQQFIEGVE